MSTTTARDSVLLTGASRGLGHHTAVFLAERGFRVFGGVRSDDAAAALDRESDGEIVPLRLDVTEPDQIAAAIDQVAAEVGDQGLAGLVNNAAIVRFGPAEQAPIEDTEATLRVNVLGPASMIKASLPLLRQGSGRVVNVSSINGVLPGPFAAAYNASKAALETRLAQAVQLALEHRPLTFVSALA